MKLITLRIDEEEKARLEQLAEAGDITLSRALREGAKLYLRDAQRRAHNARGGKATWWGVRRDNQGRPLSAGTDPTPLAARRAARMRNGLERGLIAVREAWESGTKPAVVLSALGQWLDLVGEVYVGQPNEIGWSWFLADYCPGFEDPEPRESLHREFEGSLAFGATSNVPSVLSALETGLARFVDDAEHQELVRRAVLPAWEVLEKRLQP
jgi:Ribbon-helix-helix protein, copG family